MRVRNRRKNPRCGCEHEMHFKTRYAWEDGKARIIRVPRIAHRYQHGIADGGWALYVGHVCKACEESCMRGWLVGEHVCGEGDCRRA